MGVTEQNIRNCFRALGEAARERPGRPLPRRNRVRSGGFAARRSGHHSDNFLGALLAELDGFTGRDGVAMISATNRKESAGPGPLGAHFRCRDSVNRPDMRGAREIFEIHLPQSLPFCPNGDLAAATRREIAERAVSRLYSPNAENEVCP